ncbi:MAG: branched-chain amino acid ABC transporter permease [Desulfomonilaceae bacterium]
MTSTAATVGYETKDRIPARTLVGWIVGVGVWFLPLIWIDTTTYLVLTVAGLTMGMLLFLTASGFTLIFGLMDVLNLAHGAFFSWGAYAGFSTLVLLNAVGWVETGTVSQSIYSLLIVLAVALAVGAIVGLILEQLLIRGVYGDHLKQILITMGASLIMAEIIRVVWGPNDEVTLVPAALVGSWDLFDVVINKFRAMSIIVGVAVFVAMQLVLKKTKLGIIVRGGVENREMVQAMGYDIQRIFTGVFCAGTALAAMGGAMWSLFKEQIYPDMGSENLIFALIIVIVGGMGSVTGSFLGAIMVGLAFNYVAFLVPKLALGVNILLMVVILLIKPTGLLGQE